jgi:hypothetical protein
MPSRKHRTLLAGVNSALPLRERRLRSLTADPKEIS